MSVNAEEALNDADKGALADAALEAEGQDSVDGGQVDQIDYESEAREMGWNPDYNGPNKKSAKQFYEDGQNIQPILQANLKKERQRVESLESRLREQEESSKRSIQALQKHFEREIAAVQAKKKEAVKNADTEAFEKYEKEEKELLESKPDLPEEQPKEKDFRSDPVIQQWEKENSWYGTDEELTDAADFHSTRLRKKTDKTGREFLDMVAEKVRNQFPEKFKNPRKQNFSAAPPSGRQPPAKTTSFDSLPSGAKRDYEYAVNRNLMKDTPENRSQFAKDWSEASQ